jgi:hypothetical protein
MSLFYETVMPLHDARLMVLIDDLYINMPFYGSRKIAETLRRLGSTVE